LWEVIAEKAKQNAQGAAATPHPARFVNLMKEVLELIPSEHYTLLIVSIKSLQLPLQVTTPTLNR